MRIKAKLAALMAIVGLIISLLPAQVLAATGVIYISPSHTSVQKGKEFTVALRINPGTSVDSVQATVNYGTSSLQFVSLSVGAFSTCVQDSGGGGAVTYSCAKLGGSTSSDSLIGDITFKALAGSGSTTLGVSNANAARSGSYTNPSSSGGTVSFTSPPSSSSKSPVASKPSSNTKSSSAAAPTASTSPTTAPSTKKSKPTTKASPAAPRVTLGAVSAGNVQFSTATISLAANVPIQAFIQYGTSKDALNFKTPLSKSGKIVNVSLDSSQLTPGTTYYYQAVAKDSAGKIVATSAIQSFTTKGFTVKVTVLDSKYRPLAGKTVTLHSAPMQDKTNSAGVATFTGVAPGIHHVEYRIGKHTYSQSVYVADNFTTNNGAQTAAPQTAAVVLAGYVQPAHTFPTRIVVFLGLIAVIAILFETRRPLAKRLKSTFKHMPKPPTMPTVVS